MREKNKTEAQLSRRMKNVSPYVRVSKDMAEVHNILVELKTAEDTRHAAQAMQMAEYYYTKALKGYDAAVSYSELAVSISADEWKKEDHDEFFDKHEHPGAVQGGSAYTCCEE